MLLGKDGTNTAELPQIQKYGGFYIGRYEAGTSTITLSTGINFANNSSNFIDDNFSIRDGLNHTATGKIATKAGEIPYYHADYFTALQLSNSMYQTDSIQSGLATGTMWDAMMNFIANGEDDIVVNSSWGNYKNGSINYTAGKGRYALIDTANAGMGSMIQGFTVSDGTSHYNGINTTAISEDAKKKNLYDVAGNLWEWVQEAAYQAGSEDYMHRGGSFRDNYADDPACDRARELAIDTRANGGFRPVLYIK